MKINFIRHGKTYGNLKRRYIGTTDEDLCEEGIEEIKNKIYPQAEEIISSPMKRCMQTAELIYGEGYSVYDNLRECDFGDFENKSYEDLKENPDYIKWLESNGEMSFPNGESRREFCERSCKCFEEIIANKEMKSISFVVHGGTIMAILERYFDGEKSFYDWQIKNGEYLSFELAREDNKIILR